MHYYSHDTITSVSDPVWAPVCALCDCDCLDDGLGRLLGLKYYNTVIYYFPNKTPNLSRFGVDGADDEAGLWPPLLDFIISVFVAV
jgi:hypothetical protein